MRETIFVFPLMLISTLPRFLILGLIYSLHEEYAIIPTLVIFLILAACSYNDWRKNQASKVFHGLVTALFSPCLVVEHYSNFFIRNGLLCNGLYLIMTWSLYAITITKTCLPKEVTILRCFKSEFNITKRCLHPSVKGPDLPFNIYAHSMIQYDEFSSSNNTCIGCDGFWCYSSHLLYNKSTDDSVHFVTLCPQTYDEWFYLRRFSYQITALLMISCFSIYFLSKLLDRIWKVKLMYTFCGTNILKDRQGSEYVLKLLKGEDYSELNVIVSKEFGRSLLDLLVEKRYYTLVKVKNVILISIFIIAN